MTPTLELIDVQQMNGERANWLWQRVSKQVETFNDFTRGRGELFAQRLLSPRSMVFQYGESGLLTIEDIIPRLMGVIHFFLWDTVPTGDLVAAGREACLAAFVTHDLHRISATPPVHNKMAYRLATRIGFKYEGTVRQAFLQHGVYHDVSVLGLLRHELAPRTHTGEA